MMRNQKERKGYTGKLMIECPRCRKIRGTFCKDPRHTWECECGEKIELNHLKRLYINCECGGHRKYKTNLTQQMADVPCPDCGAPVAVEWKAKKWVYTTIR